MNLRYLTFLHIVLELRSSTCMLLSLPFDPANALVPWPQTRWKAFLCGINEKHVHYAEQLHSNSYSDVRELAAASPELWEQMAKVPTGAAGITVRAAGAS